MTVSGSGSPFTSNRARTYRPRAAPPARARQPARPAAPPAPISTPSPPTLRPPLPSPLPPSILHPPRASKCPSSTPTPTSTAAPSPSTLPAAAASSTASRPRSLLSPLLRLTTADPWPHLLSGTKGMVACTQPIAAAAGLEILQAGGNAADAGTFNVYFRSGHSAELLPALSPPSVNPANSPLSCLQPSLCRPRSI